MTQEQLGMLERLQALEFSAFDFVLYLDTHPNDQRALVDYHYLVDETNQVKEAYEARYGPLTSDDAKDLTQWRWIEEPWPWEIDYQA